MPQVAMSVDVSTKNSALGDLRLDKRDSSMVIVPKSGFNTSIEQRHETLALK